MNRGDHSPPTPVGRRRGGIRQAAAAQARHSVAAIVQPVSRIPTYALLDPDAEEAIHQASMRILEEIGVDFRGDAEGLSLWRDAGAEITGERVRIPCDLAMAALALAPAQFTQHARNPARSVEIGGANLVLAPVYGPPYVRDLDGTLALDAIRDVGPSGHFFGHDHTIEHYGSAFYRPMTEESGTWDQWVEEGRRDVEVRAAGVAASLIDSFEPPPLDRGLADGLDEFVARRRRELPDEAF